MHLCGVKWCISTWRSSHGNEIEAASEDRTQDTARFGVIVFFLQIDTLGPKNVKRDKHLQNRLFEVPCAFGAN